MTKYPWDDEIMVEVRERKAHVLKKYGGIDGLHKHIKEEHPRLIKEGWVFADSDEVREKNLRRQLAEGL
jgi:hypothetical protein